MSNNFNFKYSRLSPFYNFSDDYLQSLESRIKTFHFRKKQFLFREGFAPPGMFLVIKGKAKIFKSAYNGKEVIISIARKHELLGYHYLISKTEYRTSACATEDTEIIFFPKRVFYEMVNVQPDFLLRLMQLFSEEYDKALDKLTDITSKQVRKRVAEMLLRLLKKHGAEKDERTLNIILPREDLANLVATNTETLVRTLSEFKKEKFIAFNGKKIVIMNRRRLLKVAAEY